MKELSDKELINELEERFAMRNRLLAEQSHYNAELEKVNRKLLDSEDIKSQFLSNIKNEVNNPMASIMGLLKFNIEESPDSERILANTKLIYKEAFTLNFQLQNVFMAAEIESGECMLEPMKFSVGELMSDTLDSFQSRMKEGNVKVGIFQSDDLFITSDRKKLKMIMSNLISNAIKFSPAESEIEIKLSKEKESIISVVIKDSGVGFSTENESSIYDRFRQLESGTTKSYGGHGLGLSVVHALVDLLEGDIDIHSQENKGTTVSLELPLEIKGFEDSIFETDDVHLFLEESDSEEEF